MSTATTQTARAITDLSVLQVLAKALDELLGDGQGLGDIEAPALTSLHISSMHRELPTAPVLHHTVRGVPPGHAARIVHRLIDLKRRRLVKHERRSETVSSGYPDAGKTVVLDLWSITLDGLAVARRGES